MGVVVEVSEWVREEGVVACACATLRCQGGCGWLVEDGGGLGFVPAVDSVSLRRHEACKPRSLSVSLCVQCPVPSAQSLLFLIGGAFLRLPRVKASKACVRGA